MAARSIASATALLAGANLLSRILGFGRDWLLAYGFGATAQTDVYQASFLLPDFLNYLLAGGALSVSFLPRMAKLYQDERDLPEGAARQSDEVFAIVFSLMALAATVLVALAFVFAEPIVRLWVHGFREQQVADTVRLTRIVLPAQLCFLLGGLVQACLLARQSFGAMALTPLLYNSGILIGGLIGTSMGRIDGFSWGALLGAIVGALAVPLWSARGILRIRWRFAPTHPEVKAFLWTALPLVFGVSLTTVDEWLGKRFSSSFPEGSMTQLSMARKIMLVPIGLLGTAAGQATGAFLAKLHAAGDRDGLSATLARSLSAVVGLSLLLSGFFAACAQPIAAALFRWGRYSQASAEATAAVLVPLSLGIAAWGAQSVLARAFFAVGDTWRPMIATSVVTVASLPLYFVGAQWPGHQLEGLALAGTLGMLGQATALAAMAHRWLGLDARLFARSVARSALVALVAAGVAWAVHRAVQGIWPQGWPVGLQAMATLAAAGVPWTLVALGLGGWLGMDGLPKRLQRWLPKRAENTSKSPA